MGVIVEASRSRRPRGLRRGSAAFPFLEMRVRIPQEGMDVCLVWVLCCQVEVSAADWSLVQRSPTKCGASECDREASITRKPSITMGCCATVGGGINITEFIYINLKNFVNFLPSRQAKPLSTMIPDL